MLRVWVSIWGRPCCMIIIMIIMIIIIRIMIIIIAPCSVVRADVMQLLTIHA